VNHSLTTEGIARWHPLETSGGHRGRYLWTDAFGVLNFLTLYSKTADAKYLTLAYHLINAMHNILDRTRDGKARLAGATDTHPLTRSFEN
ncbi:MAG: hypothetical protein Q9170_007034, partial [Blastenia crenularia]